MEKLFIILFEDDELLAINKPSDLVCHPTKGDVYSSLISRVRLHLGADARPQLINRLDRETSGVVLVAKEDAVAKELRQMWEHRRVHKEYLAIVHGHPKADHGMVDAPLGKDEQSKVAIKDCVRAEGLPSKTEYWTERRFERSTPAGKNENQAFSLLRVQPHTGRKHQIRIHLAHEGHPIVGDKLYGGDEDLYLALVERRLTEEQRARLILPCHALHARNVKFSWKGEEREFVAEPEKWFNEFLGKEASDSR